MKINNVIFKSEPKDLLGRLCVENHLYVKGWRLKLLLGILDYRMSDSKNIDIVVAFLNKKPIGVSVLHIGYEDIDNKNNGQRIGATFNTFVKPDYRRKGLGSALYNEMKRITKLDYKNIKMSTGNKASHSFFDSINHEYNIIDISKESIFESKYIPAYANWI